MITNEQLARDFESARPVMHLDYVLWDGEVQVTVHLGVDSAVVVVSSAGEETLKVAQAHNSIPTMDRFNIDYRMHRMREWVVDRLNDLATSHEMGVPNSDITLLR